MALALNNLKRVDMPLNKETKPNKTWQYTGWNKSKDTGERKNTYTILGQSQAIQTKRDLQKQRKKNSNKNAHGQTNNRYKETKSILE